MAKVREILASRRPALEGLAARLIEREVIDADELRQIIEENSPSPQIVPGTDTERPRPVIKHAELVEEEPSQPQTGTP